MNWNKIRKQLEGFLNPSVADRVTYSTAGYRYAPDKKNQCYLLVDKDEVLNNRNENSGVTWYQNEQEVKADPSVSISIGPEEIEGVRKSSGGKIPEDRLRVIARNQILNTYAKDVIKAQNALLKSDFTKVATSYLSKSIEECLDSEDILLNILALLDRRVGKKRIMGLEKTYGLKHPAVQYFYKLRRFG